MITCETSLPSTGYKQESAILEENKQNSAIYDNRTISGKSTKFKDEITEKSEPSEIQYFYSSEFKNNPADGVLKKVTFSQGNLRIQSLWLPSNQFVVPSKIERERFPRRARKRNYAELESPVEKKSKRKGNKRIVTKRKKKNEDEDFTPDCFDEVSSDASNTAEHEVKEDINELLERDRRVNIQFCDSNLGFVLKPVEGRWKAMVAQASRHLIENETLYPGMRVCSVENNPIPESYEFADIKAFIEGLRFPAYIEFVDVYKNRCKLCFRGFHEYEQLILHMVQHTEHRSAEPDQIDQRRRQLMNLQLQNPVMYKIYTLQHQLGRLQAHLEALMADGRFQSQVMQTEAYIKSIKSQIFLLSQQQSAMVQKQNDGSIGAEGFAKESLISGNTIAPSVMERGQGDTQATTLNSQQQILNSPDKQKDRQTEQNVSKPPSKEAGVLDGNEPTCSNKEHTDREHLSDPQALQIALGQLAALKQIYIRSPQTAIAQLAGLLQMAKTSQVSATQLRNLQLAAKTDDELSELFFDLQRNASSVLQSHLAQNQASSNSSKTHTQSQKQKQKNK